MISVYDIIYKKEPEPFPLIYTNAQLSADGDKISIHFHDQILTLRRENWEEFDLIWDYFQAKLM